MHDSAHKDAMAFAEKYLPSKPLLIADIGSYDVNGNLRDVFNNPLWGYIGYDIVAGPNVDRVLTSEYVWDIPDNTYDVVVSTQTIEHVRHPWRWIREVARICRVSGLVYICTPNTIGFHEHPVDCWRVWPEGMRALFEEAGLTALEVYAVQGKKIGDTTGIAQKAVPVI
jgi:SAM-dependent methyltransferase